MLTCNKARLILFGANASCGCRLESGFLPALLEHNGEGEMPSICTLHKWNYWGTDARKWDADGEKKVKYRARKKTGKGWVFSCAASCSLSPGERIAFSTLAWGEKDCSLSIFPFLHLSRRLHPFVSLFNQALCFALALLWHTFYSLSGRFGLK